jgi:hypothetical protein
MLKLICNDQVDDIVKKDEFTNEKIKNIVFEWIEAVKNNLLDKEIFFTEILKKDYSKINFDDKYDELFFKYLLENEKKDLVILELLKKFVIENVQIKWQIYQKEQIEKKLLKWLNLKCITKLIDVEKRLEEKEKHKEKKEKNKEINKEKHREKMEKKEKKSKKNNND